MKSDRLLPAMILLASSLFGQYFQGTMLGRITDSSGAVVPDVQVTLVTTGTGAFSNTRTYAQGNYLGSISGPPTPIPVDAGRGHRRGRPAP
jgi:hypothetical protein